MQPLTTAGFHHVALVSSDARRTLHFYRDVLGMGVVKRTVSRDDPGAYHLYFGDAAGTPGTLLSVLEARAPRGNWGSAGCTTPPSWPRTTGRCSSGSAA